MVENWDDDDFMIEDDLTFQSHAHSAKAPSTRRDSLTSLRSDFESIHGEVEEQVHLPGDDEKSTLDAIAAAAKAGIPIPTNVPSSALMGGTIKRLGGRKLKRIIQDDWVDDLEFPETGQPLSIKQQDSSKFPDSLRQVSGSSIASSPTKQPSSTPPSLVQQELLAPKLSAFSGSGSVGLNLDQFRDNDEDDDDFFGDGLETIKVSKSRPPQPISLITPPTPQKNDEPEKTTDATKDDFEADFDLPTDGQLKLATRRDIPKTPAVNTGDDFEWGEGSLGTRFGGTRRDGRSARSSSASALSPSIASSITAESENEDDGFDCLVLPTGPLNFEERLNRRRPSRSPERRVEHLDALAEEPAKEDVETPLATVVAEKEDFLADLDIGDGEVFDSKKLTLNRNIKLKETRPASPARPKAALSLKFTNKPVVSRLPRPMGSMVSHERSHTQSSLEPVSESGGPIAPSRRSLSRLGGHSSQSSGSSIPTPTTPGPSSSLPPVTPRRNQMGLGPKTSNVSLRDGPTTTSAQLLRVKRSLPAMRANPPAGRPPNSRNSIERPPSRTDLHSRPQSSMRPKTPTERPRTMDSPAAQARKPFLPAGTSTSYSHNVNARTTRTFRRHDSENSIDFRPNSRAISRSTVRSPSPRKNRNVEKVVQEGPWHQLNKPRRIRHFGDGHELDAFDDLPTSTQAEAKFIRQPVGGGPKMHLRNKTLERIVPDRTLTPSPLTPTFTATRHDNVPSFARDTAASRIARETALAQRVPSGGPLAPLTSQRVAQLSTRANFIPQLPQSTLKAKKHRKKEPSKPQLIANLNPPREPKVEKGMFYNPETFRWEGNDNVLGAFDPPASSPSTASMPPYMLREKENATPRPTLISNLNATKGVQVFNGMVFDPQNMTWLKMPQTATTEQSDPMDGFNGIESDEDVFKDIPDLEDRTIDESEGAQGRGSDLKDDWLVGEEFDVGPEFVRRQREEEERWRRKCESWVTAAGDRDQSAWRWAIRDIVNGSARD